VIEERFDIAIRALPVIEDVAGLVAKTLSEWSGDKNILHLVYPTPRGMLPSVRSPIDYLLIHVPAWLQERSIQS
jgi:hypothetical protein